MATPDVSVYQKIARYALIIAFMLLGGWMLQHFLPALCWAVVLAIGTSKLYDRWLRYFSGKHRDIWAALTFTLIVGLVLIVPLIYGGILGALLLIRVAFWLRQRSAKAKAPASRGGGSSAPLA